MKTFEQRILDALEQRILDSKKVPFYFYRHRGRGFVFIGLYPNPDCAVQAVIDLGDMAPSYYHMALRYGKPQMKSVEKVLSKLGRPELG